MSRWTAWALTSLGIAAATAVACYASSDGTPLFFLLLIWFLHPERMGRPAEAQATEERAG